MILSQLQVIFSVDMDLVRPLSSQRVGFIPPRSLSLSNTYRLDIFKNWPRHRLWMHMIYCRGWYNQWAQTVCWFITLWDKILQLRSSPLHSHYNPKPCTYLACQWLFCLTTLPEFARTFSAGAKLPQCSGFMPVLVRKQTQQLWILQVKYWLDHLSRFLQPSPLLHNQHT